MVFLKEELRERMPFRPGTATETAESGLRPTMGGEQPPRPSASVHLGVAVK